MGDALEAGTTFGSVESVKAVSDLYSPVSGTVTAVNEELKDKPEKINEDANGTWMLKLELKDAGELDALLSAADYEKFVSEETGHWERLHRNDPIHKERRTALRMRYLPKSPTDREEMLKEIGVDSIDDLFATIPGGVSIDA